MSSGVKLTPNLKTLCVALKHANGADSQSSKSVEHQPRLPLWVGNARRRLKRTQSGSSAAGTPKVEKKQSMSLLLEMPASISKTSSASSSHNQCIVIPDSPPKQPQKIFSVPWLDHQDMTLKRLSREADGKMIEESAEMLEGDNGFVFGKFKNEDYVIETEIPNLTWAKGQEVKKVPLSMEPAVKKGQAKAKAKAKASAKAAAAEEDKASSDLDPMDAEKENSAEEETAAEAAAVPSLQLMSSMAPCSTRLAPRGRLPLMLLGENSVIRSRFSVFC